MAKTIVGQANVQPYKFSECSKADYMNSLKNGNGYCLLNKPNQVRGYAVDRKKDEIESRIALGKEMLLENV